jgi:hypothetical protein
VIELASPHAVQQGCALHEIVARQREQASLRCPADRVPRAPNPLEKSVDRTRRAELAYEVDVADVDAKLQRCGRHQHLQLTALQALLGIEAMLARETAVMGSYRLGIESLRQMTRDALRQTSRVHEHQRRTVLAHELRELVVDLRPDLVRHHCFERSIGQLDREVAMTLVTAVHDATASVTSGVQALRADQQSRNIGDRFLRRGQTNARQPTARERVESLQR